MPAPGVDAFAGEAATGAWFDGGPGGTEIAAAERIGRCGRGSRRAVAAIRGAASAVVGIVVDTRKRTAAAAFRAAVDSEHALIATGGLAADLPAHR